MKLTVFQSDKGDCLLLESADKKHAMLIDGGVSRAYSEHVAPALASLRAAGRTIDIVYVSHIDDDHISGVLRLLDDEAEWRVHEHQVAHGNPSHPVPEAPRPPKVGCIFHNAFHDLVGKNSGPIEGMLAATATILSGAEHPWLKELSERRREVAASIPQAMRVSQRIKKGQLNIPLNPHFKGKLMLMNNNQPSINLGSVKLNLIGPFEQDVSNLRKEWNKWLTENSAQVKKIQAQAKTDSKNMEESVRSVIGPLTLAAELLGLRELELAKELGNRKKVTTPNLASLMFLAEEGTQKFLLTGDGHWEDILRGLEQHKRFDAKGKFRIDVLKVQHHGSEHNIAAEFCKRVIADDYVFCGNGEHENPDLDVLELIADKRSREQGKFRFWFNSNARVSVKQAGRNHMSKVERLVAKLQQKTEHRLVPKFIAKGSMSVA